ncbi:hypothetical protein BGX31_007683 [Mortierella sp. GBA43]|nr:hypothetical protein BGX31_007683 [Mortierella sp. GBA43]
MEFSSSENNTSLPKGLRTPSRISKKPRYAMEADPYSPFSARTNGPNFGLEHGQDQSQDKNSQEQQEETAEEQGPVIQNELEDTKRLVKAIEAIDLSMTETREKLKTFYKTADETNALLDMWIRVLSQAEHTQKLLMDPAWEGYNIEESRHRENQERRAAYQQAMEAANRRRSYVPNPMSTLSSTQTMSASPTTRSGGSASISTTPSMSSLSTSRYALNTQPLRKSPSELVAAAHAHASAIAANRKRNLNGGAAGNTLSRSTS